MLEILGSDKLISNTNEEYILNKIRSGDLRYYNGAFHGKLNSRISSYLTKIGATWSRVKGKFTLPKSKVPYYIIDAMVGQKATMALVTATMKSKISDIIETSVDLDYEPVFKKGLEELNENIDRTLTRKKITIGVQLDESQEDRLVREYSENYNKNIKGMRNKTLRRLRGEIEDAWKRGLRQKDIVDKITDRYAQNRKQAEFWARQELNLITSKYHQIKYQKAGSDGYYWKTVVGSVISPVRPYHKVLNGRYFDWSSPPVIDKYGNTGHPKEDYRCRCMARVVVEF